MSTRPKHDVTDISLDARRVHDQAEADLGDKTFAKRLHKGELGQFLANIEGLETGAGDRKTTLHATVAAGVHAAQARAAILATAADVREDAHLEFPDDIALQHTFGVGEDASPSSTAEVLELGRALDRAAVANPKEAAKVGLDQAGRHHLEDAIEALQGADLAHTHAATGRHTNTTHTDSLAHVVSAEVARIRRIAHRVWKDDPAKLAGYASTLPRHTVHHREPAPTTT